MTIQIDDCSKRFYYPILKTGCDYYFDYATGTSWVSLHGNHTGRKAHEFLADGYKLATNPKLRCDTDAFITFVHDLGYVLNSRGTPYPKSIEGYDDGVKATFQQVGNTFAYEGLYVTSNKSTNNEAVFISLDRAGVLAEQLHKLKALRDMFRTYMKLPNWRHVEIYEQRQPMYLEQRYLFRWDDAISVCVRHPIGAKDYESVITIEDHHRENSKLTLTVFIADIILDKFNKDKHREIYKLKDYAGNRLMNKIIVQTGTHVLPVTNASMTVVLTPQGFEMLRHVIAFLKQTVSDN